MEFGIIYTLVYVPQCKSHQQCLMKKSKLFCWLDIKHTVHEVIYAAGTCC